MRIKSSNSVSVQVAVILTGLSLAAAPRAYAGEFEQPGNRAVAGAQSGALSPAEMEMRKDLDRANNTVIGGVVVGAAVGALVGGFLAKLTGGNSKDTRNAALAGALAGGVLGGLDGYRTAKLEKAGNDQVRALQAQTADVEAETGRLRAAVASTERVIAERQVALDALMQDVTAQKISREQAREALRRDEDNLVALRKTLAKQKETFNDYVKVANSFQADDQSRQAAGMQLSKYNDEIAAMEKAISSYSNMVLSVSRA